MAKNLFGGETAKNFSIKGHPPLWSHEYVMAGGGYATSGYTTRPRSRSGADRSSVPEGNVPEGNVPELKIPDKTGPHLYEIGNSDWDAAVRWVNNLATNVDYTRKVHGVAILSPAEVAKWTDFWRRWLLFGRKVETVKTQMRDEGLAAKVLSATSPLLWASRRLYATAQGSLALMSTENKRELDRLLHEAWRLYQEFRRLGMSQVAVPYMGDLVVLLRTLPAEVTLPEMAARLRAAAQVGARLLDQNTAWWQWRKRDDTRGLTRATDDAAKLADDLEALAKTHPGAGTRDRGAPIYAKVVRTIAKVYVEAAGLYGVEETKATARAEAADEARRGPGRFASTTGWLLALAGVGYLGIRWLTNDKTVVVVESQKVGYHPDYDDDDERHAESE